MIRAGDRSPPPFFYPSSVSAEIEYYVAAGLLLCARRYTILAGAAIPCG